MKYEHIAGLTLLITIILLGTVPYLGVVIGFILFSVYLYHWYQELPIHSQREDRSFATIDPFFYSEQSRLHKFLIMKTNYLMSQKWKDKRKVVLTREDRTCQTCGATERLEIHHIKDYGLIPNEPTSSLVCLCRSCHQAQHDLHGYPQTYSDYITWNNPL